MGVSITTDEPYMNGHFDTPVVQQVIDDLQSERANLWIMCLRSIGFRIYEKVQGYLP